MTRRNAILIGLGLGPGLAAWGFSPGEFWNDKQPAQWSEKDIQRLLTNSPWAKGASIEMNFSGMGGPDGPAGGRAGAPGRGGRGMGGPPPGGGMGEAGLGAPGGREEGGGQSEPKATVRWESAPPLRAASKISLPRDASGFYVIGVSGLSGPGGRGPRPENSEADSERTRNLLENMKQATELQRKGKDPLVPAYIEQLAGERNVFFYFSITSDPILQADKEVTFRTKLGPFELKAKFVLKEMQYQGKLAI